MPYPGKRASLHAALWCQVDEAIRAQQLFATSLIERVGMENLAAVVLVKDATSRLLFAFDIGDLEIVEHLPFRQLLRGSRRLEVIIEVDAERRHPGEEPAHPFFERGDLRPRRTRHCGKRNIMMLKVLTGPIDVIAQKRATATTLLPPRSEHEVIDDELAASLEQIRERHLPVRPFEEIGLVDLHPGQLTSLPAHFIVFSRGFLLFDQEPPAGSDPFLLRYNFWMFDFDVVHRWIVWTHFQAVFPINDEQAVALGT